MKTIIFEPRAAKQFDKLPVFARDQIMEALAKFSVSGLGDVKKLQDRPGFRMRIGRYRVIFSEDQTTILLIEVLKRDSQTYK
jgi:mRNA interferase RelE/StbE